MDSAAAELSSVSTALEDLRQRITGIADAYVAGKREVEADVLYEVERQLTTASRRLARLVDGARR